MYFSDDVSKEMRELYSNLCPVATILQLNLTNYPKYVQDLKQYRFKPIYETLTLKLHKAILNIDTSIRFSKDANFKDFIKQGVKRNPTDVTLLSPANHNLFSTIHPSMFNFFPSINQQTLINIEQYQGGLGLWISSEKSWKIMKRLVECALHPNCMGPSGSTSDCDYGRIKKYPNKFSGCHRFDQAAINLILYQASNYTPSLYQWNHPGFITDKSSKLF
uniref:Uncharacterized protein n=1 Tax=Panagrolaimus superbus TaxID=310955 RepID=A0A914Y1Q0_9BILA